METDDSERLLNEIGNLLAEDVDYPLDRTLLYSEVASGTVESSIFKETGNSIIYRFSDRLWDVLLELWNAQLSDPPWVAIEYFIRGDRFEVKYTYPDDPDWEGECDLDYRAKVVARYFGDKPIIYPPMPTGDETFTL
ncbi:MAG: hypothetical protein ACRYG4_16135 [Janthinobacterium lividum]